MNKNYALATHFSTKYVSFFQMCDLNTYKVLKSVFGILWGTLKIFFGTQADFKVLL